MHEYPEIVLELTTDNSVFVLMLASRPYFPELSGNYIIVSISKIISAIFVVHGLLCSLIAASFGLLSVML